MTFFVRILNSVLNINHIAQTISILYIFTNPPPRVGSDTKSIFKQSINGLYTELSFLTSSLDKVIEASLPYYLPILGRIRYKFMPFSRACVVYFS